ncbi:uncharacterized protein LOC104883618 [Beta vulgaris subsp. vulgaris]|uniref:uncharacterized protein LOC104883618 n=1 Tax=Beta vulgaris subsp. vulgaris TaxID=3555 RepID=UPI002546F79D|nr:uncharacterized protein LOC104883618 [Beta vulgaris subsp. vulgaris]
MSDDVSWAIKTLRGEHTTCGRLEENPMVTSKWLCNKLADEVRGNPDIPVESLQKVCMNRYRLRVKRRLLYKVRSMARVELYGGFDEAYGLLPRYAEIIKETNPGSYALISWTGDTSQSQPKFKSCVIAFSAQIKGFIRGCRSIIGIDGAHLSGGYKGVMLTAVSIDGNNELFVIAYAIVPTESIDSWCYFFSNLKLIFQQEGCKRTDWTFISDRMRGVESALSDVFPQAARRICCQHLYSNCKNEGFTVDAYNQYVYTKAMEKIAKYNPKDVEYLEKCTEQWSRAFFDSGVCCDHSTTNFVESFNACTKPYRDLPVITLLEEIRIWCMKRMGERFDKAVDIRPTDLRDYAKRILETRSDESRFCYATSCGGGEYEGAAYKLTYGDHIHPMPDPTQWPDFNLPQIAPPDIKRPPGRPVKQRRRGPNEAKKGKRHNSVRCKKCKEVGHNSRTCGTDNGKGKGSKRKADGASTSQAAPKRAKKTSRADGASTSEAAPKRGKK